MTTGGPRTKKLHGRYVEVYGPYQVMLNVDGISIYTGTYVTTDSDQMGQINLGQEELARHQWEENWSDSTTGYRSSGKSDANKDLGKNGL